MYGNPMFKKWSNYKEIITKFSFKIVQRYWPHGTPKTIRHYYQFQDITALKGILWNLNIPSQGRGNPSRLWPLGHNVNSALMYCGTLSLIDFNISNDLWKSVRTEEEEDMLVCRKAETDRKRERETGREKGKEQRVTDLTVRHRQGEIEEWQSERLREGDRHRDRQRQI